MEPRISIAVTVSGGDRHSAANFLCFLHALESQSEQSWELIVVEQTFKGVKYFEFLSERRHKYVSIEAFSLCGFNLSWSRNVKPLPTPLLTWGAGRNS